MCDSLSQVDGGEDTAGEIHVASDEVWCRAMQTKKGAGEARSYVETKEKKIENGWNKITGRS